MHFKVAVRSFVLLVTPSQMFWGLLVYSGCKMNRAATFWWLSYIVSLQHQSKLLINTVSPVCLPTKVATLWLKQPTCFCSALSYLQISSNKPTTGADPEKWKERWLKWCTEGVPWKIWLINHSLGALCQSTCSCSCQCSTICSVYPVWVIDLHVMHHTLCLHEWLFK